jgi:hypothetical protein
LRVASSKPTMPTRASISRAAAIEAGANEVEPLTHAQNDDVPEGAAGARFLTERTAVHGASRWLAQNGWKIITSEIGFVPKNYPELTTRSALKRGSFSRRWKITAHG